MYETYSDILKVLENNSHTRTIKDFTAKDEKYIYKGGNNSGMLFFFAYSHYFSHDLPPSLIVTLGLDKLVDQYRHDQTQDQQDDTDRGAVSELPELECRRVKMSRDNVRPVT